MGRSSKEIDWEALERDYRLGLLTINQVADKYGVAVSSVTRRANKFKWTRDLSAQVRSGLNAKLIASNAIIEEVTKTHIDTLITRSSNDAIAVEASIDKSFEIVLSHQRVAATQKGMMEKLMSNMQEQIEAQKTTIDKLIEAVSLQHPDAIKDLYKVLSLPSQVDTMKKFTEIHNNIVATERKAFRIDVEEKQADTSIDDVIKRAREHPDYDAE